jgi:hypothetical protein
LTALDREGLMRPLMKWNAVIHKTDMPPDMDRHWPISSANN